MSIEPVKSHESSEQVKSSEPVHPNMSGGGGWGGQA